MPVKLESFGGEDMSWLASEHGTHNARTSMLDVSAFTKATHYVDGYFKAGLPVNAGAEGKVLPWTGAVGEELGFLLRNVHTDGVNDIPAPVLRHGIVKTKRLPVTFTVPTAKTAFVFITEENA